MAILPLDRNPNRALGTRKNRARRAAAMLAGAGVRRADGAGEDGAPGWRLADRRDARPDASRRSRDRIILEPIDFRPVRPAAARHGEDHVIETPPILCTSFASRTSTPAAACAAPRSDPGGGHRRAGRHALGDAGRLAGVGVSRRRPDSPSGAAELCSCQVAYRLGAEAELGAGVLHAPPRSDGSARGGVAVGAAAARGL
jgi:hypothetical protein